MAELALVLVDDGIALLLHLVIRADRQVAGVVAHEDHDVVVFHDGIIARLLVARVRLEHEVLCIHLREANGLHVLRAAFELRLRAAVRDVEDVDAQLVYSLQVLRGARHGRSLCGCTPLVPGCVAVGIVRADQAGLECAVIHDRLIAVEHDRQRLVALLVVSDGGLDLIECRVVGLIAQLAILRGVLEPCDGHRQLVIEVFLRVRLGRIGGLHRCREDRYTQGGSCNERLPFAQEIQFHDLSPSQNITFVIIGK